MLICIEGNDSSGKQTQSRRIYEYFQQQNIPSKLIAFPDYESDSSALVKMYLSGAFGMMPEDVNAKAASIFYACDRFASYKMNWEKDYKEGKVIVADRYTTSNAIHQASKIDDEAEREAFLKWLFELEYQIFGIPTPDIIIFLNMPHEISKNLMKDRANKISGEEKKDIHESNASYLEKTNKNAIEISKKLNWVEITCVNEQGQLKSVEDIHREIVSVLNEKYEFGR